MPVFSNLQMQRLCITFNLLIHVITKPSSTLSRTIVLLGLMFLLGIFKVQGQINVGVDAGIPTGKISDF
jgi:hypothetical protein